MFNFETPLVRCWEHLLHTLKILCLCSGSSPSINRNWILRYVGTLDLFHLDIISNLCISFGWYYILRGKKCLSNWIVRVKITSNYELCEKHIKLCTEYKWCICFFYQRRVPSTNISETYCFSENEKRQHECVFRHVSNRSHPCRENVAKQRIHLGVFIETLIRYLLFS